MPIEKTSPDIQDSKSYHQVTFLPPLITNESKVIIKMRRACRVCAQIFAILIVTELLQWKPRDLLNSRNWKVGEFKSCAPQYIEEIIVHTRNTGKLAPFFSQNLCKVLMPMSRCSELAG